MCDMNEYHLNKRAYQITTERKLAQAMYGKKTGSFTVGADANRHTILRMLIFSHVGEMYQFHPLPL